MGNCSLVVMVVCRSSSSFSLPLQMLRGSPWRPLPGAVAMCCVSVAERLDNRWLYKHVSRHIASHRRQRELTVSPVCTGATLKHSRASIFGLCGHVCLIIGHIWWIQEQNVWQGNDWGLELMMEVFSARSIFTRDLQSGLSVWANQTEQQSGRGHTDGHIGDWKNSRQQSEDWSPFIKQTAHAQSQCWSVWRWTDLRSVLSGR